MFLIRMSFTFDVNGCETIAGVKYGIRVLVDFEKSGVGIFCFNEC